MNKLIRIICILMLFSNFSLAQAATNLADRPLFSSSSVTGNVALTLSVEFPTALGSAYTNGYSSTNVYLGYFDSDKCYNYHTEADVNKHYFEPVSLAASRVCGGQWSGNFLNWALTQTIDPFRSALTGGYRRVDEVGLTVLEKAWASGQGGTVANPTISNNPTLIAGATPYNFLDFKIRINGLGNKFYFTSTGDNNNPGATGGLILDTAIPALPAANRVHEMYARVKVCVPGLLETNCTLYSGNYKPTGLIQKNALKLNFAAFGYLNDPGRAPVAVNDDRNRRIDGGVLRAKMAPLGPMKSVPGSADVVNSNPEWDINTGIFSVNPDSVASAASGVTNSGVINYLNKFGLTSGSYKKYDPVSELYYTAIRYFKNQGNVPAYTSMAEYTAAERAVLIDGFPVITNWDDPVKYSCQSNFIIGVGDTNSHVDGNLPGSTTPGIPSAAMPAEVSGDTTVDAKVATNRVGNMQGIGNIGGYYSGTNNTRLIAGLAYDSHTVDMRPDFTGSQTVTTYWLDVLESNFVGNNQYFLATKFGGFDVPVGYDPYSATVTPLTVGQWDKNGDGDPDNYFRANNPALMIANLGKAFDDILKKISGSSGGFAITTPSVATGDMSFATSFKVDGWTGDVIGNNLTYASDGSIIETLAWNAVDKLETQAASTGWDTARSIGTSNCVALSVTDGTQTCTGAPFRLASLTTNAVNLGVTPADQQALLNFLRGDRSNAGSQGLAIFRDRTKLLGDIVNSRVTAVGKPEAPYTDSFNPGYSTFRSSKSSRATVVYVGANDGMLHAFRGTSSGGTELFAYVPNAAYAGPNATPADDGLAGLAKTAYVHHNYVDATPRVVDVNFGGGSSDWHSLLVGGLGKGGKSYYAIDVTNPATLNSENNLAAAVKWEFTHKHMGYTYGRPLMVKTAKYGWVVILTSGYNNDDGQGYFFIVNPETGVLLETISTGEGSVASEAGLAHVNAFVTDFRSFIADAIYAGDLRGNVWRVDLTGTSGNYPAPVKIASLTSGGNPQPVTTPPIIEVDQSTSKRYVFVGTGRLLADSDVASTQQQTFYAINDGTQSTLFTSATLPSGVSFPITKTNLNNLTNNPNGLGTSPANPSGYYIDLGYGTNGVGYRVNIPMVSGAGVIVFAANLTGGDECTPSGSNQIYAVTYGSGRSVLSSNNVPIRSVSGSGLAVSLTGYTTTLPGGEPGKQIITVCNAEGTCTPIELNTAGSSGFTPLNWRELPSAE
ncbi:MAG TPA: PilC/PilY family type IV pilus protein [Methylophilaceae bacterium]|nr:PilC/PilY family type IV pilus protein [Methylophilaceae bacterium]